MNFDARNCAAKKKDLLHRVYHNQNSAPELSNLQDEASHNPTEEHAIRREEAEYIAMSEELEPWY